MRSFIRHCDEEYSFEQLTQLPLLRDCIFSAQHCVRSLSSLEEGGRLDGSNAIPVYWAYISVLVLSAPFAAELRQRRIKHTPPYLTDLIAQRADLIKPLKDCLHILPRNHQASPTSNRFAEVARRVCSAIQIEAEQAKAKGKGNESNTPFSAELPLIPLFEFDTNAAFPISSFTSELPFEPQTTGMFSHSVDNDYPPSTSLDDLLQWLQSTSSETGV